jgi:hypothetical protein
MYIYTNTHATVALSVLAFGSTGKTRTKNRVRASRTITSCYQKVLSYTWEIFKVEDNITDDVYSNAVRFDTDSYPTKINNCCTQTMSVFKEDFQQDTLKPIHGKHIIGFANTKTPITHKGTIVWHVTDDTGSAHNISISYSYYVPGCNVRLLSPQHWSQEA